MITQTIYLPSVDWTIHAFFAVDKYNVHDIIARLSDIGCRNGQLERAYKNLIANNLDTGLTFSNPLIKESVVVTSLTTTAAEFFNSLMHELNHVTGHICQANDYARGSEDEAYLIGELSWCVYPKVKSLLCDHCRHSHGGGYIPPSVRLRAHVGCS